MKYIEMDFCYCAAACSMTHCPRHKDNAPRPAADEIFIGTWADFQGTRDCPFFTPNSERQ